MLCQDKPVVILLDMPIALLLPLESATIIRRSNCSRYSLNTWVRMSLLMLFIYLVKQNLPWLPQTVRSFPEVSTYISLLNGPLLCSPCGSQLLPLGMFGNASSTRPGKSPVSTPSAVYCSQLALSYVPMGPLITKTSEHTSRALSSYYVHRK